MARAALLVIGDMAAAGGGVASAATTPRFRSSCWSWKGFTTARENDRCLRCLPRAPAAREVFPPAPEAVVWASCACAAAFASSCAACGKGGTDVSVSRWCAAHMQPHPQSQRTPLRACSAAASCAIAARSHASTSSGSLPSMTMRPDLLLAVSRRWSRINCTRTPARLLTAHHADSRVEVTHLVGFDGGVDVRFGESSGPHDASTFTRIQLPFVVVAI